VDEESERGVVPRVRQEQVDGLPRRVAVGKAELGAPALEHLGAIVLGVPRPPRKKLRMLRHAGA
jgi:hypothetical protein